MTAFIPGRELCRQFYTDVVRPILETSFPDLPYGAALLGRGSEVLGFDDEMSTDHNGEARVVLFLRENDHAEIGDDIAEVLRGELPAQFGGRPTDHELHTLRGYVSHQLEFDLADELEPRDWLSFSELRLGMITAGAVFHDDIGLQAVRDRFAYYPHDVWLYLLAAGWWRLHPEINLVGRAGSVGDELGSALIGSQLVHDLMRLCFLMERRYAPYSKWFGTAFSKLTCGPDLSPLLWKVLRAETCQQREEALLGAYEVLAAMHNALGITEPVMTEIHRLWDRPFQVLWGDFPGALQAEIRDPAVKRIADRWPTGGVERVRDVLMARRSRRAILASLTEE